MNTRIRELALEAFQPINDIASEGIADRYTFDQPWFQLYNQKFAQQIVGETVLAALATNLQEHICTSYDADMARAVTNKIVDNIRNHWSFK